MTIVRAFLRRNLTIHPGSEELPQKHELDWFATRFINDPGQIWDLPSYSSGIQRRYSTSVGSSLKRSVGYRWLSLRATKKCQPASTPDMDPKKLIDSPPIFGFRAVMPSGKATKSCDTSNLQEAVQVRQRLRHLAGLVSWHTPETEDYASSVARAIQDFMNKIYEENLELKPAPGNTENPKREISWDLPCHWNKKDETVTLSVERRVGTNIWSIDEKSIEALLLIWLYSFEVQYLNHIPSQREKDLDSQSLGPNNDLPLSGTHMRVLSKYTENVRLELGWWVERGGRDTVQKYKLSQEDLDSGFLPTKDIRTSRIMGFLDRESTKSRSTSDATDYLVSLTRIPTVQFLAQHIFTSFMWAVVDDLYPLQADIPKYAPGDEIPEKPKVQSTPLRRFVNNIATSTTLGSVEELYSCIIPPLSSRGKLSGADCIIEHAHMRVMGVLGRDLHDKWEAVGRIYTNLFETSMKFGSRTETGIKMTVVLADFCSFLTMKIGQTAPDSTALKTLETLQDKVWQSLERADFAVLSELTMIYEQLKDVPTHKGLLKIKKAKERSGSTITAEDNEIYGRNEYHKVRFSSIAGYHGIRSRDL